MGRSAPANIWEMKFANYLHLQEELLLEACYKILQENKITSHSYNNSRNYQTHVVLLILPPKLILQ